MNRESPIKINSIAENCRSILREYCCLQQSHNHTDVSDTFPQQQYSSDGWKPCYTIPTNPICSPYGVDNLQVPVMCYEKPSYSNALFGLSPTIPTTSNFIGYPNCMDGNTVMIPSNVNTQTNHIQCLSVPSENCIQLITNTIITKIRCKVPEEEIALLYCCLPSLIQQIMCKSPWLTPNDIIQWLSEDIIKEAINCYDQDDFNEKNKFYKPKQVHNIRERSTQKKKDNIFKDNISMKSRENDNDSLSSYQSTTNISSPESIINPSKNIDRKYKNKNEKIGTDNKYKNSDRNSPIQSEENEKSFSSPDKDSYLSTNTFDSNEDFDQKSIEKSPKVESDKRSPRPHIEYPGKKDPNIIQDVEKCLAFYHKIREYFDDDIAAMLLKCCLCYGDCSGKK